MALDTWTMTITGGFGDSVSKAIAAFNVTPTYPMGFVGRPAIPTTGQLWPRIYQG